MLNTFFLAEPGSRVVQEIVCYILIYAVSAEVDKEHTLYLSKNHKDVCIFVTDKTPARHIFLMKLVVLFIVVFYGHDASSVKMR